MPARPDGPDAGTLSWVARQLGGDAVVRARRLTGGLATATHLLTLTSGRRVVLRRYHPSWLEREPDLVRGEAAAVAHVAGRGLPTPELLAVDADGAGTGGRPAMLMARLPGRIELTPSDPHDWLQQMAGALAAVHEIPPVPWAAPAVDPPHVDATKPPPWSVHPHLWAEAIESATSRQPAPVFDTLVHGDFQHFNLLWSRGRLSGIVDWNAPHGRPLDADVGHCRLNLVILYGTEVADDFLRRYERAAGRRVDPWWDLRETVIFLPSWAPGIARQVGPRLAVRADEINRRVDAHLPTLLRRLELSRRSRGRRAP